MKYVLMSFICLVISCNSYASDSLQIKNNLSCIASKDLKNNLLKIINNPKDYINSDNNDNCVLELIDSVAKYAIVTKDENYLKALNVICSHSDGYISEAMMEVCKDQFYQNFYMLIDYCYNTKSCLRIMIIQGLSMEISDAEDRKLQEKKLDKFIANHLKRIAQEKDRILFIQKIRNEVNPKMFD